MIRRMDSEGKLEILGGYDALYDADGTSRAARPPQMRQASGGAGVFYAAAGGGRCVPLLRVLMTNVCENDCRYCSINCHRQVRRTSFQPEELVKTFKQMRDRGLVRGLFLSSGVAGGAAKTAERMLTTVEILRLRERFSGYIHLKIMPGQPADYIERAVALADRVSVNIEAATPGYLARIAPSKRYEAIIPPMEEVRRLQQRYPRLLRAGQITQMVVGAAGESDREVLQTSQNLYDRLAMRRVYYSGYQPVYGEELAPPASDLRQHRLYQADWLLRFYGFSFEEVPFDEEGSLPAELDPKAAWALLHPECFPLEVNRASYEQLLRVPGIGPVSARRIVALRAACTFRDLKELSRLGAAVKRARQFLLLDGRYLGDRALADRPTAVQDIDPFQLSLWDAQPRCLTPALA
jgi:putative DNA modification/repair radical SAM protein